MFWKYPNIAEKTYLWQQATRNFASEAQQLSKKLEEKEQEVRLTNVERARMQKHLQNLERLILRSVKPTVRPYFDLIFEKCL